MNTASRSTYSYAVLRYVHDIATGEFINVGVVLLSSQAAYVGAKFKTTYGRVKKTFPSLDADAFRARMRRLQAIFDDIAQGDIEAQSAVGSSKRAASVEELVHSVLRQDDSSLQWSPAGGGLSKDLDSTLSTLYERFVGKYDADTISSARKDDDVWRPFRAALEKRNVLGYLEEKVISVADDSIKFDYAWKNGVWNCFEPLSFDLASEISIKEKAHRWLGQVASIKDAEDAFNVVFLVGKPTDVDLGDAYQQALSILRKAPSSTVVEEAMVEKFSDDLASEIALHESGSI